MKTAMALTLTVLLAPGLALAEEKNPLLGTWAVVKAERRGKPLEEIKDDQLVVEAKNITVKTKKKEEKASYTFKLNKDGKSGEIDVTPAGDTELVKGIFKIEGDILTLCFGDEKADRPTKYASTGDGAGHMLIELKRQKK